MTNQIGPEAIEMKEEEEDVVEEVETTGIEMTAAITLITTIIITTTTWEEVMEAGKGENLYLWNLSNQEMEVHPRKKQYVGSLWKNYSHFE